MLVRSCRAGRSWVFAWLCLWLCPGMYGESSEPILIIFYCLLLWPRCAWSWGIPPRVKLKPKPEWLRSHVCSLLIALNYEPVSYPWNVSKVYPSITKALNGFYRNLPISCIKNIQRTLLSQITCSMEYTNTEISCIHPTRDGPGPKYNQGSKWILLEFAHQLHFTKDTSFPDNL